MTDIVERLAQLLADSGLRVTLDVGRDHTHPCTFCAAPAEPTHKLVTIGTYQNGEELTRPVCERCMPLAAVEGADLLPVPTDSGYRWEFAKNAHGKLRIGLWHGPRLMGWLKWAWRGNAWQAKQQAPLFPGRLSLPEYAASTGARIVLWKGSFEDCAWGLLAACETGWHDDLERHWERLAMFRGCGT